MRRWPEKSGLRTALVAWSAGEWSSRALEGTSVERQRQDAEMAGEVWTPNGWRVEQCCSRVWRLEGSRG
jgi:hypothetical protein